MSASFTRFLLLQFTWVSLSLSVSFDYSTNGAYMIPINPILYKDPLDAEQYCVAYGTHLASIHNAAQQSEATALCSDNIYSHLPNHQGCTIGLNDISNERVADRTDWEWFDQSPYDYSNWKEGEPNQFNGIEEDCVGIALNANAFWNDFPCAHNTHWNMSFLCNAVTVSPTVRPPSPSSGPTLTPSSMPSLSPSSLPSAQPTLSPTSKPTLQPTVVPTTHPSQTPSIHPTMNPSSEPSADPTLNPSSDPQMQPTVAPTRQPSHGPSAQPTMNPISNRVWEREVESQESTETPYNPTNIRSQSQDSDSDNEHWLSIPFSEMEMIWMGSFVAVLCCICIVVKCICSKAKPIGKHMSANLESGIDKDNAKGVELSQVEGNTIGNMHQMNIVQVKETLGGPNENEFQYGISTEDDETDEEIVNSIATQGMADGIADDEFEVVGEEGKTDR